jgi:uncharacterized protein YcbX
MSVVGKIESLWRYPVKSMRGEELKEAFVGFSGIYGDRIFAFKSSGGRLGFPYLTARELEEMLLYSPKFRYSNKSTMPPDLMHAEKQGPGLNPPFAEFSDLSVDVSTPYGEVLPIDDFKLLRALSERVGGGHVLTLLRSHRAMTDCRPISLFSIQTVRYFSKNIGTAVDKRRFRANIYVDLSSDQSFHENSFVGQTLRIGSKVAISIRERDPRCKMITLDPDTAESMPEILQRVLENHGGMAGVYGAVLIEGMVRVGDNIELLVD